MYEINFESPAFLLSLLCFVYCLTAKHKQYIPPKGFKNKMTSQHFAFLIMLVANMLSSISSVVGVYLTTATFENVAFWQYLFHAFYFFFHTTLSVSFSLYIMNVTGTSLKWKITGYILFFSPYFISEILVLTNSFTSWAFYMDENLLYHRGPLMPLLYGFGAIYVILGFVFFMKNKKAISRVDRIAVGSFIIIATLGIIIQAIKSSYLVELFAEALACLVIMMVLEEKSGRIEPITGLLNRVAFVDANRKLIGSKHKYQLVLIRIAELEKFLKRFSGHEADEFLIAVSSFLTSEASGCEVYTYRREDFGVIFKDDKYNLANEFEQKVLERFGREWIFDSLSIKVDAITTVVRVPKDVHKLEDVTSIVSSYYKKDKVGSYSVPFEELYELIKANSYETALKDAISGNKLTLFYQPIWSTKEKKVVSAEALLRINSKELKALSPEVYIPVAEKTGLIKDIGLFVFEEVCRFLKDERLKETGIRYVELNLSIYQFMYSDLVDRFEEIRKNYGIDSSQINLEITETATELDSSEIIETLKEFRDLGYSLSLDDFGTGYSNFMRMIGTNYQNIKIDKSILWNLSKDEEDSKMLSNLIHFIKSLGSDIIQEGVETKEQLDLVTKCGCNYIQGYYFSKPVPKDEFFESISGWDALADNA